MSLAGEPVEGITLQEGGLELQLTLLNATTMQPLSDDHNPRPQEGLLAETKENKKVRLEMPLTVRLTGSCYTFKFFVLLLSSDISGALIKIKVSPPNANAADPLCVVTRAFKSRARSNLHEVGSKRPRTDNSGHNDLCAGDDDGPPNFTSCGAGADEGPPPCFRSLGGDDDEVPLGRSSESRRHFPHGDTSLHDEEEASAPAYSRSLTLSADDSQPMFRSLSAGGDDEDSNQFRSLSAEGGDEEDSNQDEDADKEDEDGHTHKQISGALIKIK